MTQRTHDQWRQLFQQQKESGLSIHAFCEQQLIAPSYYYRRRRELGQEAPQTGLVALMPAMPPAASGLWLCTKSGALHFGAAVSPLFVAELVKALA